MQLKKPRIEVIREELALLSKYQAVVYGSFVTGEFRKGSDVDVAVITGIKDVKKNVEIQKSFFGKFNPVYDIRVFELLPIKVKASVFSNYLVLFGDELEISEYFYYWRKLWEDVRHRISYHESYIEKMKAIERGKRFKLKEKRI